MMTSPKVIFNCKFTHAFNRREEKYTPKQIEGLKKKIARKFDYFSNEDKRVMNLFDYYTGELNKNERMNLVIEDGSYATKEEIEKRKKRFVKYAENSNLWQCVISFNNDYLNENISLQELEQELIKNVLPRFFRKMGFKDKKYMAYNLSFHTDTDNLHAHVSFIEKKPNYILSNNKLAYRRKGKLTQEEIDFMKNEVVFAVERKKYLNPMITITNEEIDKLKMATTDGKNWLIQLEANERKKTGIKGLKVGFNKVFGYYIEVTKSNISLVPDRYIRKQTLTNGERYVTEELKKLENELLGAEEKVINLEYNAFCEIREIIEKQLLRIQRTADIVATLDVLNSFAIVAEDMNYCMPIVDNSGIIDIKGGRHPVIEKILPSGEFVDNDTYLDKEDNRFSIITGPNMAGKSTYMRQVALITLMAQCGSFVPATFARLGVVDKIFTRIGASDDLSMGQSTFMVEMMEVATILKEATQNSLVILDEIGRGTSTYDGLSIAWAVAEYMSDKEKCGAKTLFATHYHELIGLEQKIQGVKNYSIAVKEKGEDIIFLRKIVAGGTDESYGVHVAKLAGVPQTVTKRSNEILRTLERKSILGSKEQEKENKKVAEGQLDMYNYKLAEIAHEIDKIDLNSLTPIDALNTLVKIKDKMAN